MSREHEAYLEHQREAGHVAEHYAEEARGECEACGKRDVVLARGEAAGCEVYACAECHGYPAGAFDEDNGADLTPASTDIDPEDTFGDLSSVR